MASRSLLLELEQKKNVPRVYLTREVQKLLDKLGVVYNIKSRTKLLETLILNQIFVLAETPPPLKDGKHKSALAYCKKFAAEYAERMKVLNVNGS